MRVTSPIMLRRVWFVFLLLWCSAPTQADDFHPHLSQYAHSAWRVQDGVLSSAPRVITQTTDGYLWIGSSTGLLRFDGVRLVPWAPSDGAWASAPPSIYALLGGRDGSLWIGGSPYLARVKDGRLTNYAKVGGRVEAIVEDPRGSIWFTRDRVEDGSGPLCQIIDGHLRCYGAADGIGLPGATPLIADSDGTLWFGGAEGLSRWSPRSSNTDTDRLRELKPAASLSGVSALAPAPDGSMWIGMIRSGPGLGLQQVQRGAWKPVTMPGLDGSKLGVNALFMDRDGAMWIGTEGQGIYRVVAGQVDRFVRADGLSADSVTSFYQDREGNIWVTTPEGIDCFRKTPVISFSVSQGLTANQAASVLATGDGAVWIGNEGALDVLRDGRVSSIAPGKGLPGASVTALLEDHAGRRWVGVDNGLHVFDHGTFRSIRGRDGGPVGVVRSMTEDSAGDIWAVVLGKPRRLIRIADFKVQEDVRPPGMSPPYAVTADPTGGIWIGTSTGDLARYRQGQVEVFRFTHGAGLPVGQVVATADGSALATTSTGVIGWGNGAPRTLTVRNGLPCANVYGLVFDQRRALWLYTQCGLVRVTDSDLQKWWADANAVIPMRVFDALTGVRAGVASFTPSASRSPDGRLWFANETVVQMIDPAHLGENSIPPPVHIEQVIADRQSYLPTDAVRLPPLTRDIQIDYVGLSFVAPQTVHFRYRLEGRDASWQESGSRRQAFYSDLRPGRYRFRVVASNNDGLWNDEGAALDIVVAPAWYQSDWFLVLSIATGLVAVWAGYQLRIRQVARSLNARFDERLAERTRMARDLHDTLLQTVQGSKMVADNALNQPDDGAEWRHAMEQVSTWLGQASTEGREAVNALRASTVETNDLAEAFRRAIEDCRRSGALQASLTVMGDPRELHPVVRDDVYRIGYEAIRNACTHSGGSRLSVALTYGRDLIVNVLDDGVGIDPAFANAGKDGHFGLQGMRERASRIGAALTMVNPTSGGTELTLVVPGRVVFREPAASLFDRIKARFTGSAQV